MTPLWIVDSGWLTADVATKSETKDIIRLRDVHLWSSSQPCVNYPVRKLTLSADIQLISYQYKQYKGIGEQIFHFLSLLKDFTMTTFFQVSFFAHVDLEGIDLSFLVTLHLPSRNKSVVHSFITSSCVSI